MRALTRLPTLALLAWIALPMGEAAAQFGRGSTTGRVPRDTGTAAPAAAAGPAGPAEPPRAGADPGRPDPGALAQRGAVRRHQPRRPAGGARRGGARRRPRIAQRARPDADRCGGRPGPQRDHVLPAVGPRRHPASPARRPRMRPPPRRSRASAAPRRPGRGPAAGEIDRSVPMPAPTVRNPRLWAGDGGAAMPDIGFLGFDAGRPAGAVAPGLGTPRALPPRRARLMELGLGGRAAIVSGASRGIGLAIAQRLAAEGMRVLRVARGGHRDGRARRARGRPARSGCERPRRWRMPWRGSAGSTWW